MDERLIPADVILADGTLAVIRQVRAEDEAALNGFANRCCDESLPTRCLGFSRRNPHTYVAHVLGDQTTLALIAEANGLLLGLGTAEPLNDATSEVALLVVDDARGDGVGALLLEHLAAMALSRGVTHLEASVLPDNHLMLSVLADSGFETARTSNREVVLVGLTTGVSEKSLALADAREFRAEENSLAPLLRPASVVVVGVRSNGTGIGATVLRLIRSGGFQGWVAAIHPRASSLAGVPAFSSLADVPRPVDLVVLCVPAAVAPDVLAAAADIGVRAAVVISSGFSETGTDGAELQARLLSSARTHSIRVVGPNCLGILCNAPAVRLNATFNEDVPPPGSLAVASQSGGVGIVVMDLARELGVGVHTFISLGNKADVSSNDLLAAWYDDPDIRAAALYLESFGNPTKFARFARRFAERKPLLAVVGGRSAGGSRAGASHTAAAATPAVGVEALFSQAGVIACDSAEELVQAALFLAEQPLPQGRRLGILSNAGGMAVLAADEAAELGLDVPEFSGKLRNLLAAVAHHTTGTSNPVDGGAGVLPTEFAMMADTILASGEVDALLIVPVATGVSDGVATMTELARVRGKHPKLPVVAVPLGGLVSVDGEPRLTSYRSTSTALRALGRAVRYAEWLAVPRGRLHLSGPDEVVARRKDVRALLPSNGADTWLRPDQANVLLAPYGIKPLGRTVHNTHDAEAVASEIGFPVALKVADADVVHKTERGLVRVGLRTPEDIRDAMNHFSRELHGEPAVLVQPVVQGIEIALGVIHDRAFGPLVMVAAGGVATSVWDDRVFLVPPLSDADAARALRSLKVWPLLTGFRGAEAADIDALITMVVNVGRLAVDLPEVAELDLNPVLVGPTGCAVVDVKTRLSEPVGPDYSAPRQLRPTPTRTGL